MKPTKTLLVVAALLSPAIALAQPGYGGGGGGYYAQPSRIPGGFHDRTGRLTYGGSLGVGGMSDRGGDIQCSNCNTIAGEGEFHIGGMMGPRFALLFEAQANVQTLQQGQFSDQDVMLTQVGLMVAGQYWLTPQLWIKGGIGVAHLSLDDAYNTQDLANGTAILGAAGYELLSARSFSVDLQGRLFNGSYKGIDNNVTAASIGVGINWY